jgi:glycosyltransferase involved in cell wall biosynthesis
MSSKPSVSAIIIFLDAERFIEEAIESVIAQTYDNWELLLVDDGSTDGSTQIALQYVEQYPSKVRYLEHPGHQNRGKETSRNLGISHAKGEYIGFLDADDVWLSYTLERQLAVLDSHPEAGMVYGAAHYWYGWTSNPEDSQRDFLHSVEEQGFEPDTLVEPLMWLATFLRAGGAAPCICSVLVRCEIAKSIGGFEEEFRGQYEDQAFFVKAGLQAPVFVASECWSRYRQHADSSWLVTQKTDQQHTMRLYFLNWLAEYLYEQEVKDTEVWKLLQEAQLQVHSKQLEQLERALKKEHREVRRLRQRNQQLRLRIQDMNRQAQSGLNYRIRKLSKRFGLLRARLPGR